MPRTYALALIFIILTLIGGAFYGQYRYLTDGRVEAEVFAAEVHERVVAGQLEEMAELAQTANERMKDETKGRFRPILPFVEDAFNQRDAYLDKVEKEWAETRGDMASFLRFHDRQLTDLSLAYNSLLRKFGHQMDLSENDIETKIFNTEKMVGGLYSVCISAPEALLSSRLFMLDYLEVVRNVARDVVDISGGKVISCHFGPQHFPIFSANIENPRKGENVLAKISVGSYFTELDPKNIILLIDKDTVSVNPYGIADYSFTPTQRGKLELNIELGVVNPLTGEVLRNETKRVFNIR